MKKNILVLSSVLILMLTLVVGCNTNEKILICNKTTEDSSGFKIVEKYSYKFIGNNIKKFGVVVTSTPTKDELKEFLSAFSSSVNDGFKELKDKSGVDYNSQIKDNSHILTIDIDYNMIKLKEFDNVSDGISEIINKDNEKFSISDIRNEMEQEDYICTIK